MMVEDSQSNLKQFWRRKTTSEDLTRWRESIRQIYQAEEYMNNRMETVLNTYIEGILLDVHKTIWWILLGSRFKV